MKGGTRRGNKSHLVDTCHQQQLNLNFKHLTCWTNFSSVTRTVDEMSVDELRIRWVVMEPAKSVDNSGMKKQEQRGNEFFPFFTQNQNWFEILCIKINFESVYRGAVAQSVERLYKGSWLVQLFWRGFESRPWHKVEGRSWLSPRQGNENAIRKTRTKKLSSLLRS